MEESNFKIDESLAQSLWQVPVPIGIIRDSSLSPNALRLYLDLLSYARENTTCYPSAKVLADDIGLSERYIRTLSNELRERGLLTWTTARGGDGRDHNTYTLLEYKPIKKSRVNHSSQVPCSTVHGNNTNWNNTQEYNIKEEERAHFTNGEDSASRPLSVSKQASGDTHEATNPPESSSAVPPPSAQPSEEEAVEYAETVGQSRDAAIAWHRFTAAGDWKDSKGKSIRNWKKAFLAWKPRNVGSHRTEKPKGLRNAALSEKDYFADMINI